MTDFLNQKVSGFMEDIQSISPEQYQIAVQVRELYYKFDPGLVEEIKYGGLVFLRGKDLLGGIFFYKEHISIEFSYGVNLSDPASVLEGKGKLRRHIKLRSLNDVVTKRVNNYIKEALDAS